MPTEMVDWDEGNPRLKILRRKREQIVGAARELFLAHGFASTTMVEVARRAGVSSATLYRHAPIKEALFAEVVRLNLPLAEVSEGFARLAAMPLRDMLTAMGSGTQFLLLEPERLEFYRIVVAEARHFPHLGTMLHDAHRGHMAAALAGQLEARQIANARALADTFMADVVGDLQMRLLLGTSEITEVEKEARVARAVETLLGAAGLSQPR